MSRTWVELPEMHPSREMHGSVEEPYGVPPSSEPASASLLPASCASPVSGFGEVFGEFQFSKVELKFKKIKFNFLTELNFENSF